MYSVGEDTTVAAVCPVASEVEATSPKKKKS